MNYSSDILRYQPLFGATSATVRSSACDTGAILNKPGPRGVGAPYMHAGQGVALVPYVTSPAISAVLFPVGIRTPATARAVRGGAVNSNAGSAFKRL